MLTQVTRETGSEHSARYIERREEAAGPNVRRSKCLSSPENGHRCDVRRRRRSGLSRSALGASAFLRTPRVWMPAPYAILEALTVLLGLLASIILVVVFSVDSWEEATYSFTPANTSYRQVTVAASDAQVTVYSIRGSLADAWSTYYFYYQYWGLWKLCDLLTGLLYFSLSSSSPSGYYIQRGFL